MAAVFTPSSGSSQVILRGVEISVNTVAGTLTIINPAGYTSVVEVINEIATTVMIRAAHNFAKALLRQTTLSDPDARLASEVALQVADMLIQRKIAASIARYYTFYISPTTLERVYSKIRDNKLTGAGPTQDTLGHQLIPFNYAGVAGNLQPIVPGIRAWQFSPAWHYFALFEQFFVKQNSDLIFVLNDEAAIGRLDSFRYSLDANNPWNIRYSFAASIYPNGIFDLNSGYVAEAFNTVRPMNTASLRRQQQRAVGSGIDVFEDVYMAGTTKVEV